MLLRRKRRLKSAARAKSQFQNQPAAPSKARPCRRCGLRKKAALAGAAVHNGRVVNSGDGEIALALRVYAKYGYVPLHIDRVVQQPPPPERAAVADGELFRRGVSRWVIDELHHLIDLIDEKRLRPVRCLRIGRPNRRVHKHLKPVNLIGQERFKVAGFIFSGRWGRGTHPLIGEFDDAIDVIDKNRALVI
jgi:hypothetical protein